jgi:uncharacterized damage-inducible protein DinB
MHESTPRHLGVAPLPDASADIGRWLWALEDTRRRTKEALGDIGASVLDWIPPVGGSSIGTLLYHTAAIELDWLSSDVLEGHVPWTPELEVLFARDVRDEHGRLSAVRGVSLADHVARLDSVRRHLLTTFRAMSPHEFRRVRSLPTYTVTPEWILHHLMQHEAEHRGTSRCCAAGLSRCWEHRDRRDCG